MPQQVDDTTGEPVRASARWREGQRQAMVQRLHELTQANNALYAKIVELEGAQDGYATRIMGLEARVEALGRPRWWQVWR